VSRNIDPHLFRDACRTGTGLVVNGNTVPELGKCDACGGVLTIQREVDLGACVDCWGEGAHVEQHGDAWVIENGVVVA
jgi:hypothetical protein